MYSFKKNKMKKLYPLILAVLISIEVHSQNL
jgi:hypothetical protein